MIDPLSFGIGAASLIALGLLGACLRPNAIVAAPRLVIAMAGLISIGALSALIEVSPLGLTIDVDPASEPLICTAIEPDRRLHGGGADAALYRNVQHFRARTD